MRNRLSAWTFLGKDTAISAEDLELRTLRPLKNLIGWLNTEGRLGKWPIKMRVKQYPRDGGNDETDMHAS